MKWLPFCLLALSLRIINPKMKKSKLNNLNKSQVKNKPGTYTLYNRRGTPIYIGHSKILRHRLQSYVEKDDYREHPTKRRLRKEATQYTYKYMPLKKARKREKTCKKRRNSYKHNYG